MIELNEKAKNLKVGSQDLLKDWLGAYLELSESYILIREYVPAPYSFLTIYEKTIGKSSIALVYDSIKRIIGRYKNIKFLIYLKSINKKFESFLVDKFNTKNDIERAVKILLSIVVKPFLFLLEIFSYLIFLFFTIIDLPNILLGLVIIITSFIIHIINNNFVFIITVLSLWFFMIHNK